MLQWELSPGTQKFKTILALKQRVSQCLQVGVRHDIKVDRDVEKRIIEWLKACSPMVDGWVAGVEGVRCEPAGLQSRILKSMLEQTESQRRLRGANVCLVPTPIIRQDISAFK